MTTEIETLDLTGLDAVSRGYALGNFCLKHGTSSDVMKFLEKHSELTCRATLRKPRERIVLNRAGGEAGPIQSAEKTMVFDSVERIGELVGFASALGAGYFELKKAAGAAISIAAETLAELNAKTTTPAKE